MSSKKGSDSMTLKFNIENIDVYLVNALRRIIIAETPVMAVDRVLYYNNTSTIDDETLAHRLGLTPLKTDLKTYNTVNECTCKSKGCSKCTAVLTLDVEGPTTVYSGDLKSSDPEITPVHDNIPLVKLTENQVIKLEATAQLGTGKEHIKWQPGLAAYEVRKNNSIEFTVESYGQYPAKELLTNAITVLKNKIKSMNNVLK